MPFIQHRGEVQGGAAGVETGRFQEFGDHNDGHVAFLADLPAHLETVRGGGLYVCSQLVYKITIVRDPSGKLIYLKCGKEARGWKVLTLFVIPAMCSYLSQAKGDRSANETRAPEQSALEIRRHSIMKSASTGTRKGRSPSPVTWMFLFAFFLPVFSWAAPAVPLLTPQEAVRIGLENNFDLALARGQTAVATNNRRAGVGPFLPEVSANAGFGGELGDRATRTTLGASAGLLVFDGFQSYHGYQRLKSQESAAGLAQRLALESTLESILSGYFSIVREKRRLDAIRELLAVSEERAKLAQARMEVGAGSRLEQLQALSDLNADSSSFLGQEVALRDAKLRLNQLLARNPVQDFEVQDSIPLEPGLRVEELRSRLGEENASLRQARALRSASASALREARGGYLPDLNAGLRYSTTPEALSGDPALPAQEEGVTYSLSLSVPIFDRLRTRRDVGNARIGLRQDETRLKQKELEIRGEFEQAAERHASGLRQVALEERNLEVSRLQAEAAREKFRLGASSPLEFRDAQTRLLDSQSRLANARQETKVAELALKRLSGSLVKETP